MRPIGLRLYLSKLITGAVCGASSGNGYLRDGDGGYHKIAEVDLMRDRIICEDGFWSCYEWIEQNERSDEHELFIES